MLYHQPRKPYMVQICYVHLPNPSLNPPFLNDAAFRDLLYSWVHDGNHSKVVSDLSGLLSRTQGHEDSPLPEGSHISLVALGFSALPGLY